jgi:NTP pyrophosphatase (non-canonical NTP hydrolase)
MWGLQELKRHNLNALAKRIFDNAKKHGFHEEGENIPEKLMLIVSELGEACDALRCGARFDAVVAAEAVGLVVLQGLNSLPGGFFEGFVKDTFEDELADVLIRTLDLMCSLGIDIDFHVREKMRYNEGRPYRHGKLF